MAKKFICYIDPLTNRYAGTILYEPEIYDAIKNGKFSDARVSGMTPLFGVPVPKVIPSKWDGTKWNTIDVYYIHPVTKQYLGMGTEGSPGIDHVGMDALPDNAPEPLGVPCTWNGTSWDAIPETYKQTRQTEYREELGPPPDQLDALYKGLSLLIPDLAKAGILSAETVTALTPDKTAPADTPAGWLGKVADIKARNPKP